MSPRSEHTRECGKRGERDDGYEAHVLAQSGQQSSGTRTP